MLGYKVFLVDEKGRLYTDPSKAAAAHSKKTYWTEGNSHFITGNVIRCKRGFHLYDEIPCIEGTYSPHDVVRVGIVKGYGHYSGYAHSTGNTYSSKIAFENLTLLEVITEPMEQCELDVAVNQTGSVVVKSLKKAMAKWRKK